VIRPKQQRSAAARAASRRNGRRSNGPRSTAGKAASAMNARKHGLFGAAPLDHEMPESTAAGELARRLAAMGAGSDETTTEKFEVLRAAVSLEAATTLVRDARIELARLLSFAETDLGDITAAAKSLARLCGYQRRFRGQRDRAIRHLRADSAVDKSQALAPPAGAAVGA
jgi:hypothetical protein